MAPNVQLRLLGRTTALVDGAEIATGPATRALLAHLAAQAGEPVATAALVGGVYGPNAIGSDRDALRKAVHRLRRALGAQTIIHEGMAYRLNLDACELDTVRFEQFVDDALATSDPGARSESLSEGLRLWHSTQFAPHVAAHPRLAAADARLTDLRRGAMEYLGAAYLELDRPSEAVRVLRRLIDEEPSRQRAWDLLQQARAGEAATTPQPAPAHADADAEGILPATLRAVRSHGPFVGRADELATIGAAVTQAGGGVRLVLIAGEAGIGKTRLAAEAAAGAAQQGMTVLFANALAVGGAVRDPLRRVTVDLVRGLSEQERAALLEGPLGRLFDDDTSGVFPASVSVAQDQAALRRSLTDVIARHTREDALLIVLDDLHEAPAETWLALEDLVLERAEANCCVIGTLRTPNRAVGMSERLRRAGAVLDVGLSGLDERGVRELVAAAETDIDDRESHSRTVVELTGGNPLLATALIQNPLDAPAVGGSDQVVHAVKAILNSVAASAIAVLAPAATEGLQFGLHVLVAAANELGLGDHRDVLAALDAATRAGVVHAVPGTEQRFAWSHELVRRHVYDQAWAQHTHLHLAVGHAIESLYGADPIDPDVLADHFARAWPACPTALAVDHLAAAARRARRELDHAREDHHLTRALRILALDPAQDHGRYGELLLAAGAARSDYDDVQRARDAFQGAARVARERGAGNQLTLAAIGYSETFGSQQRDLRARQLLNAALELRPADPLLAAGLLRQLNLTDTAAGSTELSRVINEPTAHSSEYRFKVLCDQWGLWLGNRRSAIAAELEKIAADSGDSVQLATSALLNWITQLAQGSATLADAGPQQFVAEVAGESSDYDLRWRWNAWQAAVALARGQFDSAHRWTLAARRLVAPGSLGEWSHRFRSSRAVSSAANQHVLRQIVQGVGVEFDSGAKDVRLASRWRGLDPDYVQMNALHQAYETLDSALSRVRPAAPLSSDVLAAGIPLARAASSLGHAEAIHSAQQALRPHLGTHAIPGPATYLGPVDHYAGRLALAAGKPADAVEHFETAVRMSREIGAITFEILGQRWHATALWRRGSGDHPLAQRMWDQANDAAQQIGMGATAGTGLHPS